MKRFKKKTCYLVIVASIPFLIQSGNLTKSLGYNDPVTILFYILSLIIFIPGILCLLFFSEKTISYGTEKPTKKRIYISILIFICIFVSIQIARHAYKTVNTPSKIEVANQINRIFNDKYEIVEIKTISFKEVLVPKENDLDCKYYYFSEGIKKKALEVVTILKASDGNLKEYSLFLSKDGVLLHSLPCGLVKEIKQSNASNKTLENDVNR